MSGGREFKTLPAANPFWDSPEYKLHVQATNIIHQTEGYRYLCEQLQKRFINNTCIKDVKKIIQENETKWIANLEQFEKLLASFATKPTTDDKSVVSTYIKQEIEAAYTNAIANYLAELELPDFRLQNIHNAQQFREMLGVIKTYINSVNLQQEDKVLNDALASYLSRINELNDELAKIKNLQKKIKPTNVAVKSAPEPKPAPANPLKTSI